ncbi:MAG: SDR family oxidoreductase [Planctomycetota bacterium]
MEHYTLLTGASGLVGRYLMRDLLKKGHRLAVLVRKSRRESAKARVESIMQMWEQQDDVRYPRPICIEGDVNSPGLGISPKAEHWLEEHCGRILHNAAVLEFNGSDRSREPWRTNYGGTKAILEFAEQIGVRKFDYVSTAYVCGKRPGPILETELDCGQGFRNDYEQSKFESEQMVVNNSFIDPPRIFRPAVIAGDSQTGYTSTFHGLYVYMRVISTLAKITPRDSSGRRYTPFRAPVNGDELRNIICVDWVSAVIAELFDKEETQGMTFHLTPDRATTAKELMDASQTYFNTYGVEFAGIGYEYGRDITLFERAFQLDTETYRQYESSDPVFDTTNLRKHSSLPCPPITEELLHRFWDFCHDCKWGKKRSKKLRKLTWAEDLLSGASAKQQRGTQDMLQDADTTGVDVLGPGGGQFHLRRDGQQIQVHSGLPAQNARVVNTSVPELQELLGQ